MVEKERGVCNWMHNREGLCHTNFNIDFFQFLLVLLSLSNMWYYLDLWHVPLSDHRQLKMKKFELQTEVPLSLWRRNIPYMLINKVVSIKSIASNYVKEEHVGVVQPKKRLGNCGIRWINVFKSLRCDGESYSTDKTKKRVSAKVRLEGCDCLMKNEK